jgi:hypothetical protein
MKALPKIIRSRMKYEMNYKMIDGKNQVSQNANTENLFHIKLKRQSVDP